MPSERGPNLALCQALLDRPPSRLADSMPCAPDLEERQEHGPLDLHEGICDPLASGCRRWPENLRLLNHSTGELVPGRCRATNLCPYCARLFAVETSEMLALDAMEDAPTLYVVLTAREHLTRRDCYSHLRQLRRALRKRWPAVRWATTVEFQKRGALHLNLLIKGVPVGELDAFHARIVELWCARVDALPSAQWSDVIDQALGVVRYISLHFLKSSQAPAIGWRGHRYSSTRDYLVRPAAVMREEARQSLRLKRLLHRGLDLVDAELELAVANAVTWELKSVGKLSRDPDRARAEAASMPFRSFRPSPDSAVRQHLERVPSARADVKPAQRAIVGRAVSSPEPTTSDSTR